MTNRTLGSGIAGIALVLLIVGGMPALGETVAYKADLKGSTEVPPNDSKGVGTVDAAYDPPSRKLTWITSYTGLSGNATAAHFHGPADAGQNAPPVLLINGDLSSPIKGEAILTESQAADFQAGRWYFNVHTAAHKDGEIRGQLVKK